MSNPTSVRLEPRTIEFYRSTFGGLHGGLVYTLEMVEALYRRFLADTLPQFTTAERLLVVDVLNGTYLTAGIAGQHVEADVVDGIALDHVDQKWDVDRETIIKKITSLDLFSRACLEIWSQRRMRELAGETEN